MSGGVFGFFFDSIANTTARIIKDKIAAITTKKFCLLFFLDVLAISFLL